MSYGSESLIFKPTEQMQEGIVKDLESLKRKMNLEQSFDDEKDEPDEDADVVLPE